MKPDTLFEVSWEVCNKVGGIYTVITTKVPSMVDQFGENFILIGPDVVRESNGNPDFIPDDQLYRTWKDQAISEGLEVRVGRWDIPDKPVVILIDFYHFISLKDEIFKKFWETYKLDSLSGQWDYVEPALFGYAAGRVIESFTNFHYGTRENVMAQFHEWMTGAGILYLKESAPHIATAFTTHATTLGRAIAGNNRPLYGNMESWIPAQVAREFNIISKHSLESISACEADVFTTVSQITGKECTQFLGKDPDVITPNGFDDTFGPEAGKIAENREKSRQKLLSVASTLKGRNFDKNALLVGISGRYEYRNKGIDLFLEALRLMKEEHPSRPVIGFLLIPANHSGPRHDLLEALEHDHPLQSENRYLTHGLHQPEHDIIARTIEEKNLDQNESDIPTVIFVPCYLDGEDGIFQMHYYEVLSGLDLTVFPSYYEPWGYTPLESIVYGVPTVTTTLAGFGLWIKEHVQVHNSGITVLDRTDDNDEKISMEIAAKIMEFASMDHENYQKASEEAREVASAANWKQFSRHYLEAYALALEKLQNRFKTGGAVPQQIVPYISVNHRSSHPDWKSFFVKPKLPERLNPLSELAMNLWWSWNNNAIDLWRAIDEEAWVRSGMNPVLMLKTIDYSKLKKMSLNQAFQKQMEAVMAEFQQYLNQKPKSDEPLVAYFSMEFGLVESLKIYSGGLGILAGDYLKEASDQNRRMVGVGLLYRHGYFKQVLSVNGEQQEVYEAEQFLDLPVRPVKDNHGNFLSVGVALPGRTIILRIWEVSVGRIKLYLLDSDHEANQSRDRQITHHLYGGDNENRLKQEMVLGIGGVRALQALGIQPDIYHSNEGHSAFNVIERLNQLIRKHYLTFAEAREVVRSSTLFTTHTPVPAGHDTFDEDLIRSYMAHFPERLKISWDEFMDLGRKPGDHSGRFNMSFLAAHLSGGINGVSKLHGKVSRELFHDLWPGYLKEELNIGYVTNGVHFDTWVSPKLKNYLRNSHPASDKAISPESDIWKKIEIMPDKDLWEIRRQAKRDLFEHIRDRFKRNGARRFESPRKMMEVTRNLNDEILTIGFARRFATYKRGGLLFRNLERIKKIVTHPKRPVQFIFAGKAHPNDGGGKELIRKIFEYSKDPEFQGRIIFLENYDMALARKMLQGVDVWLNTPTRPLEASGTSGEKGVMNGTLHFSVLDGWWVEGYREGAGWALPQERTYTQQDYQDEMDSEMIYNLLESEITPLYYSRDKNGIPTGWLKHIRKTLLEVAPEFTMTRMMNDYYHRFYGTLHHLGGELTKDNFRNAQMLALWKYQMISQIDEIKVIEKDFDTGSPSTYNVGEEYTGNVVLDLGEVLPEWIRLELVVTDVKVGEEPVLLHKQSFEYRSSEDSKAHYTVRIIPTIPGFFHYGIRIVPVHPLLPGGVEMSLVRWL